MEKLYWQDYAGVVHNHSVIEGSEEMMDKTGNTYDYMIYEGAGHAFMCRGDDPDAPADDPNVKARNQSWVRMIEIL